MNNVDNSDERGAKMVKLRNMLLSIILEAQYQQYLRLAQNESRKDYYNALKDTWNYRARVAWANAE